jgi:HlyD family secretion protein
MGSSLSTEWTFREAVVLQRTQRASRSLLYVVLGLSGVGLVWLVIAPLNETVLVLGKLEPNSKVKIVQTPVPGVVDTVMVKEGAAVKAGQVLLQFDLRDVSNQLASANTIKRQLLEENATYAAALGDQTTLAKLTPNQRQRLASQSEELRNKRDEALAQLRRSEVRISGLRQSVATARNIANRYEPLVRSGAVSEVQLLEARNKTQELATQLAEEERESIRLQAQLRSTRSGPSADLRGRIEANIRQIAEQDAKISTAKQQLLYGEIRSPATGRIFDLDVRRGSVAQAGQPLLRVVPDDALQAKVYVASNVIGFIHPGQRADLSLDTFPASDYGRIDAVVASVSTDALTPEKQKEALGTEAAGLHYPATLTLKRQTLQAGSKRIALQPGMSLSADIQLRQRRMLSVVTGFFEDKLRNLERMR